jgi:hypothetical protein
METPFYSFQMTKTLKVFKKPDAEIKFKSESNVTV